MTVISKKLSFFQMSARIEEVAVEQIMSDILYHVENSENIDKLIYQ